MRSGAARWATRAGLLLGGLAVALVVAEVVITRLDLFGVSYYRDVNRYINEAIRLVPEAVRPEGRIFENRPGVALDYVRFRHRSGVHGLRRPVGREDAPVPEDAFHVLFLGDSVTFAWGVDDGESWIRRVEREGRPVSGGELRCSNAGHLSYDTVQEADWLEAHGEELRPDAVVLTYVVNDVESTWEQYRDVLREGEGLKVPEPTWGQRLQAMLAVRFRGLHATWHVFRERLRRNEESGDGGTGIEGKPGFREGWERSRAGLERIRRSCDALGAPLLVLDNTEPRIEGVARWCAERGIPCHTLRFTDEEWELGLTNSIADAHANELGQRFYAEKALGALKEVGWLRADGE